MRLLHCSTFQFSEFFDEEVPPYIILSHRWSAEEVSYKDFSKGRGTRLAGYRKIWDFCRFVRDNAITTGKRIEYVWVDTCCIDKRSSAELTEAINSMWSWYAKARVCVVHLADVHQSARGESLDSQLERSVWFNRGWTLQELLSPAEVVFCSSDWQVLGHKCRAEADLQTLHRKAIGCQLRNCGRILNRKISAITGIQLEYLEQPEFVFLASIARRLSWAAKRKTTRREDEAYCLLGLCGISMPLLYGEGPRAFRRLQEQLIAQSDDQSIFAWSSTSDFLGILAPSPSDFVDSGKIVRIDNYRTLPYAITNIDRLRIECKPQRVVVADEECLIVRLNCNEHIEQEQDLVRLKIIPVEIILEAWGMPWTGREQHSWSPRELQRRTRDYQREELGNQTLYIKM